MPPSEAKFLLIYFGAALTAMTVAVGCVVFIFVAGLFRLDDRFHAVAQISDAIQGRLHWLFAAIMIWLVLGGIAWITILPTDIRLTIAYFNLPPRL